jgi:YrbI family 3-deoxy-D-manno-octulosonate 8-phosphate phosphatase|tara:strand:- start:1820 stop:2308 length:489 start_codon:yes stop_codon:yes gene_type:complete
MNIQQIEAIVFDFDGVLTDNRVYIDQDGREMVCCNRSDGLSFEALKKTGVKLFILSGEAISVVKHRGDKLKIKVIQGCKNKKKTLLDLSRKEEFQLAKTLFVGNDLNDFRAMELCGFSACPADSHPAILKFAQYPLVSKGGHGVVRELTEEVFKLDILFLIE